jgi:hypothetical protein
VLVRAEPVDLEAQAAGIERTADEVRTPSMAVYAADHAEYLRSMSGGLRRQVYLVVKGRDAHALDARCEEVLTLLLPMGLAARELEGAEAVGLLARSTGQQEPDPLQAGPSDVVTTSTGGRHALDD